MIGCIKAISPCVKSASAKLFLDLHTVLAPSGEERTLGAAAQVERARLCLRMCALTKAGHECVLCCAILVHATALDPHGRSVLRDAMAPETCASQAYAGGG